MLLVVEGRVAFLDVGRIFKKKLAHFGGGLGGKNGPLRNPRLPSVEDCRCGPDGRGTKSTASLGRVKGKLKVFGFGVLAMSLEQPAVKQQLFAVDLQQVPGPGHFPGRAGEQYFRHQPPQANPRPSRFQVEGRRD